MSSDILCINRKDHCHHVFSELGTYLREHALVDVTLSCENQTIPAHRIILSICSPTIKHLLDKNPCTHPVIVFHGMKFCDLSSIVSFMYNGEVDVSVAGLNSFLAAAKQLQVHGLVVDQNAEDDSTSSPSVDKDEIHPVILPKTSTAMEDVETPVTDQQLNDAARFELSSYINSDVEPQVVREQKDKTNKVKKTTGSNEEHQKSEQLNHATGEFETVLNPLRPLDMSPVLRGKPKKVFKPTEPNTQAEYKDIRPKLVQPKISSSLFGKGVFGTNSFGNVTISKVKGSDGASVSNRQIDSTKRPIENNNNMKRPNDDDNTKKPIDDNNTKRPIDNNNNNKPENKRIKSNNEERPPATKLHTSIFALNSLKTNSTTSSEESEEIIVLPDLLSTVVVKEEIVLDNEEKYSAAVKAVPPAVASAASAAPSKPPASAAPSKPPASAAQSAASAGPSTSAGPAKPVPKGNTIKLKEVGYPIDMKLYAQKGMVEKLTVDHLKGFLRAQGKKQGMAWKKKAELVADIYSHFKMKGDLD